MTEPAVVQLSVAARRGRQDQADLLRRADRPRPADGIIIKLPPHAGPVTLTFDLHNRHTYSEEQIKANRAYRRYTATIGVLTMDNTCCRGRSSRTSSARRRTSSIASAAEPGPAA